jgi:hypothetical protein
MTGGDEWSWAPVDLFYSRRIEELDWGLKGFGTVGPHRFGMLDAYRSGGENHLVWNYELLLGTEGSIGFAGVDRRVPGEPDNSAHSIGTHWNFPFMGGSRSFGADYYRCRTDGEGGDDEAVYVSADVWRRQGWGGWLSYSSVGSEFRADDGYVPDPGARSLSSGLSYGRSYDEGSLQSQNWDLDVSSGDSEEGERRRFGIGHRREWRSGWRFSTGLSRGERDGFDVVSNRLGIDWNTRDMYRRGELDISWGERYGEPYRYYGISQGFRPAERLSASLGAERVFAADFDDDGNFVPAEWSDQLVLTTTYDITEEKTASARLVVGESGTNYYAAYRQRARRGMDLLVVAGDPNADEWVSRLAVKAIWCF